MKTSVLITAIICITALEAWALYNGINGTILTLVIAAIAAVAGIAIPASKVPILNKMLKGGD